MSLFTPRIQSQKVRIFVKSDGMLIEILLAEFQYVSLLGIKS